MLARVAATGLALVLVTASAVVGAQEKQEKQPKRAAVEATPSTWKVERGKWMPLPDIFPEGGQMQVIRGDPARGRSDMYFRFPPGYAVPLHFHTPEERVFVDQGMMRFETIDGKVTTLKEGGSVLFPSRAPHRAKCVSQDECTFYLSSSGPFDIHLIDEQGRVTRSWRAGQ